MKEGKKGCNKGEEEAERKDGKHEVMKEEGEGDERREMIRSDLME